METGTAQTPCPFQVLFGSFIPQGSEQDRECTLAPTAPHLTEAALTTGGSPVGGGEGRSENQSKQAQASGGWLVLSSTHFLCNKSKAAQLDHKVAYTAEVGKAEVSQS